MQLSTNMPEAEDKPGISRNSRDRNVSAIMADFEITTKMKGISLEEISSVRLMDRTDTKFILSSTRVPSILQQIAGDYYVLEIDGIRIAAYETIYYDTPAYKAYHDHVNGKLNRSKIRKRSYVDCDLHFLEVKRKTNTGKTKKNRIKLNGDDDVFDEDAYHLVAKYGCTDLFLLFPVLRNRFKRITLVNMDKTERVTVDFNISYSKIGNGKEILIPYVAIIEIKQEKNSFSPIRKILATERIRNTGFSKYCLGLSLLEPAPRIKSYKRKLRTIQKITEHELIA